MGSSKGRRQRLLERSNQQEQAEGLAVVLSAAQPSSLWTSRLGKERTRLRAKCSRREGDQYGVMMERAEVELERRSRYLSSLIRQQRNRILDKETAAGEGRREEGKGWKVPMEEERVAVVKEKRQGEALGDEVARELPKEEGGHGGRGGDIDHRETCSNVRVRAADMPSELQKRAFRFAQEVLVGMPRVDSKRLALMLKKEFDSSCGPAWHCIVGTSFGSYVTHSLGVFLYFSIDNVHILLFRTAVEPLEQ